MKSWLQVLLYLSIIITFSLAVISLPDSISSGSPERNSPGDWIKEEQITLSDNSVSVEINGAAIAKFANTNSMDPIIDEYSSGIEIKPEYPQQIKKGDIIVYDKGEDKNIIHRVVDIGSDEQGIYYLVKGDNNDVIDQVKVRFLDIKFFTFWVSVSKSYSCG